MDSQENVDQIEEIDITAKINNIALDNLDSNNVEPG